MAALVKVTDFLSGQPVIVNADRIQSIKRMDEKTVIEFDRDKICCTESPETIYNAVPAQRA
jgi:uncharacterized protein YlzI (FlbEa/FlbD family)